MKISRVGGIIAAASQKVARPMMQVGSISIIRRIVITFQQAGIFPIVIITGADEDQVRYELSDHGVIFVSSAPSSNAKLLECAQIGMRYLEEKCDQIVFTPVNTPMFRPDTLQKLICATGDIVTPVCGGKQGHPLLVSAAAAQQIAHSFSGEGLQEVSQSIAGDKIAVEVEDQGILTNIHNDRELQEQLESHNQSILHPQIQLSFGRETPFFNARLKLLLFLVSDTNNMRKACSAMAISYGKAWDMINRLERELGYFVVERAQGGKNGGNTCLTEQGSTFLLACQKYEESVFQFAQNQFQEMFIASKIMG